MIAPSKLRKLILEGLVKFHEDKTASSEYEENTMWTFCANLIATYSEASISTFQPNEIRELFYKEILPSLQNMNYGYDEKIVEKLKNLGKKTFIKVTSENLITDDEQSENNDNIESELKILSEEQVSFNESQFEIFSENVNGDPLNLISQKDVNDESNNAVKENQSDDVHPPILHTDINDVVISNTNEDFLIHSLWQQANLTESQINEGLYNDRLTNSYSHSLLCSDNMIVLHPSENLFCLQKSNKSISNPSSTIDSSEDARLVIDEDTTNNQNEELRKTKRTIGKKFKDQNLKKQCLRPKKVVIPSQIIVSSNKLLLEGNEKNDISKKDSNAENVHVEICTEKLTDKNTKDQSGSIEKQKAVESVEKVFDTQLIDIVPLLIKNKVKNLRNNTKQNMTVSKNNSNFAENVKDIPQTNLSRIRNVDINEINNWPMADSETEDENTQNEVEIEQITQSVPLSESLSNSQNSINSHIDVMAQERIDKFFNTMPKEFLISNNNQTNNENVTNDSREMLSRLLSPTSSNELTANKENNFKTPKKKKFTATSDRRNNFSELLSLTFSPITKPKKSNINIKDLPMVDSESDEEENVEQPRKKFTTTPSKSNSKLSHTFYNC
ncbi:hypothetical protein PVAND_000178 [Polypedilum vanderplanki]|uniref:Uncharacterized protein n=1 Tax=Polypedilum vanderplanki TaxID=319348 RepID=A0A9J6BJX2_POLVA|nr:hypothetical protein PVAND_000178 [Polypedilum vanderplanki]